MNTINKEVPELLMCDSKYLYNGAKGLMSVSLNSDFLSRGIVTLEGVIDRCAANKFLKEMIYLSQRGDPIKIIINSDGGEVNAGLLIYDILDGFKNDVDIYCAGRAASMAAVILAAGKPGRRHILPHSSVMIHEVLLGGGVSGSATSISKISESIMEIRDLVNSILAKHTGKTTEEINEATSYDNIMNAEQAIAFGIVDDIVCSIA